MSALQHVAGRVWFHPPGVVPGTVEAGVGVVDLGTATVLVDAGNGPGHAERIRAAVEAAGLAAPSRIVLTHHHWDHAWGASSWPDAQVVSHHLTRRRLEQEAVRPWSAAGLRALGRQQPRLSITLAARSRAVADWEAFEVRTPDTTFADELVLGDGLVARHVGGRHAADSIVVEDLASRVLLLGDCYYAPPLAERSDSADIDTGLLRRLLRGRAQWLVESHAPPWRGAAD
jgi:glyoxylase-like metal-dependent hydrolase (beta-lactamase superfamily II)